MRTSRRGQKTISSRGWRTIEKAAGIPPESRIYVNRDLRMSAVLAVGFDMDHTLALYRKRPFEELAFEKAKRKLLAAGYPSDVADLRYDASFVIRGLIVDKRRGNILKMDQHRYVAQAYHGTSRLPDEERKRLYQRSPIRLSGDSFMPIDTPFSLPEIDLYAQLVDLADRKRWRAHRYRTLYDEVRWAVDQAHADGSIKNEIAKDPGRFLVRDPSLPATLHRMKEHGYRLFLLTNSEASYTSLIMDRLLGGMIPSKRGWTEFFDLVVVRAGKPGFFRNRTVSMPTALPGVRRASERLKAVAGGGVRDLERRIGCAGDRILYFGDHTYGDILKSKRVRMWRTAMVIQELEEELTARGRMAASIERLHRARERREQLDLVRDGLDRAARGDAPPQLPGLGRKRARDLRDRIDERLRILQREIDGLAGLIDRAHNIHWGPVFRTGHAPSHFAEQVQDFACIYTGRVSNFIHYPVAKYFHVLPEVMPHER
ncbi:MAG: HAD-IG family 5'-nucleotidase [Candidatus Eisenbacteria bacterium]|nr:HAD-IG family 5'-nucleotidase [Candidatus Eisenbacteria bacterium]